MATAPPSERTLRIWRRAVLKRWPMVSVKAHEAALARLIAQHAKDRRRTEAWANVTIIKTTAALTARGRKLERAVRHLAAWPAGHDPVGCWDCEQVGVLLAAPPPVTKR